MLTFGTHKVVQQRCLQKVLPGVRYKMPSSCLFCCLMISIVPTTFLLGETVINPSLFVFPMSLMISIYISSHTFSLSEKSQIKRSCFFPSIWYPRRMRRLQVVFGMQTPSGTVALSRMYIHMCVCVGACSPLPPQWVLLFSSLFWANLVRVFQVGADLIPFSFPAGLALCFSQDLSNALNWWTRRKTSVWTRNKTLLFPIFESIVLKLKIFKCSLFFFTVVYVT